MLKHAFTLFWGKFRIFAPVPFLCLSFCLCYFLSFFSNYVVSITSFVLCIILNLQREFQQGVSVGVPHHVTTRDNPITWGQFLSKLVFQLKVLWKVFASHCILIQIIQEFSASFFKLVFCLFEKNIAFKVQYLMISFWYQSQLAPIAYRFSCVPFTALFFLLL